MYLYRNNPFQLKLFDIYIISWLFLTDLRVSSLLFAPLDDMDHLVDLHDSTLRDIVDECAPLRTKEMLRRKC